MLESSQENVHAVVDRGPLTQVYLDATALNLTVGQASALFQSGGYPNLAVTATNSVAGQISVQRYIDQAGTIPQGPAVTLALSAGVSGTLNINDGAPFQSFKITITGAGALSGIGALLQSA